MEADEKIEHHGGKVEAPLINRSGFPISVQNWNLMWDNILQRYPGEKEELERRIRDNEELKVRQIAKAPNLNDEISVRRKVDAIQAFINQLEYNHTGMQFFEIKKRRPISGLMETAKEIIRQSLPIKCLEAVILSLYLTSGILGLDRFVISFRSKFQADSFSHVVLGLRCGNVYGAIGLSRRMELMYKPLTYASLTDLILDYEAAYQSCFHKLKRVWLSFPVSHDCHSHDKIYWDYVNIPLKKLRKEELDTIVTKFAREIRLLTTRYNCS